MIDQAREFLWLALRPQFLPILRIFAARKLWGGDSGLDNTREASLSWCQEHLTDTRSALARFAGDPPDTSIRMRFPSLFALADQAAQTCPVTMGGPGDLDLLFGCAEALGATRAVETGVAYGWSSLALLLSLSTRKGSELVSTDLPYPGRGNEPYVGCVVPQHLREGWTLMRQADRDALPLAIAQLGTIDLCHYDSDKSYHGRMWAYPRLWDALRPGGIFISDDIGDNVAFRDFARIINLKPLVVECDGKYVGILAKPQ